MIITYFGSEQVIDEPTPDFFAEIANAMPELEYLSVIGYTGASHSRAGPWPHPSVSEEFDIFPSAPWLLLTSALNRPTTLHLSATLNT